MIRVSISSSQEIFVIRLKHKIEYVVEKKFGKIKSLNKRAIFIFGHLFLSLTKLIIKEITVRGSAKLMVYSNFKQKE
jgi:hypothetical protein